MLPIGIKKKQFFPKKTNSKPISDRFESYENQFRKCAKPLTIGLITKLSCALSDIITIFIVILIGSRSKFIFVTKI